MLIYGDYSITAEKTITGGIPKSWCDYIPEGTCGLHPHHISGVTIDSDEVDKMDHCNLFIKFYSTIIQIIDIRYIQK